jgi:hypothetical protein
MTADPEEGTTMRTTMERALHDVHPPVDLGRDAIAIGHRLQTRRRLGLAAGGLAAVAVVAAITVPFMGGDASKAVDGNGFASSPTASAPATTPGDTPSTWDPDMDNPWPDLEVPEGWWDMPADEMLAALEAHLPADVTITDPDASTEVDNGPGVITAVLSGPAGTGLVSILLRPPPLEEIPPPVTSTDANGDEHVSMMAETVPYARNIGCRESYLACELIRDAAGTKIGDVSTELHSGTTYHNADLLGPDGGAINVYVADSTGEKPGYEPPTAEAPLLTLKQVRALVEDPIWTSYQP